MDTINLSAFRDYVKTKFRFTQIYANQLSKFGERNFRKRIFAIKSNLGETEQDEQLYIPINLWRAVTRTYTDYVIGKGFSADFWVDTDNKEFVKISDEIWLQLLLNEAINTQSSVGYSILRVRSKNKKPRVEVIPVTNYCANMSGLMIGDGFEDIKEHLVFSVVKQELGRVFYVDRYEKTESWWMGYYWEIWEYSESFVLKRRISEAQEEEKLDYLPLFLFNNDLLNIHTAVEDYKTDKLGDIPRHFGQSDYVDVADILQELNDRGSQISIEFVKNLTSKLSVPASFKGAQSAQGLRKKTETAVPKTHNPDFIIHGTGEQPAQYITKDWGYLDISIQHYIPLLLNFVSLLTGVPASMLWGEALFGGNNPVGTTEKEFEKFYARVTSKQNRIYAPLQKLCAAIMRATGKTVTALPTIKFAKTQTWDIGQRTEIASTQMNLGIMSKASALQFAMGYDEAETKEELEKINQEMVDAYARDWWFLDTTKEEDE